MPIFKEAAGRLMVMFLSLLAAACAGPTMHVPVTRPAEIYLKEPRKILVTDFRGNGGQLMTAELRRQLSQSGKFEVLDKAAVEQKLLAGSPKLQPTASQAVTSALLDRLYKPGKGRGFGREAMELMLREVDPGLVGPDKQTIVAEIAKLIGGGYLLSGEMTGFSYKKQDGNGPPMRDAKGKTYRTFQKQGMASVSADVQITNISTGSVVANRTIAKTAQRTTEARDRQPPDPDKNAILNEAVMGGAADFVRRITPHIDYVDISFAKNDMKLPETDRGYEFARSGRWSEAAEQFKAAVKLNPASQGAWWNLGLACEYSNRFDDAEAAFREAIKLGRCDKCNWEIHNLRTRAEDMKKLQEQR